MLRIRITKGIRKEKEKEKAHWNTFTQGRKQRSRRGGGGERKREWYNLVKKEEESEL